MKFVSNDELHIIIFIQSLKNQQQLQLYNLLINVSPLLHERAIVIGMCAGLLMRPDISASSIIMIHTYLKSCQHFYPSLVYSPHFMLNIETRHELGRACVGLYSNNNNICFLKKIYSAYLGYLYCICIIYAILYNKVEYNMLN